jgi:hypothetical protein
VAEAEDADEDLDEAHRELQGLYPGLDWDGQVGEAVSQALEMGFELGRDFANRYPS